MVTTSGPQTRKLTDAEWAIVGPAVERAINAQDAVKRLVAMIAVKDGTDPDAAVLQGRVLVVSDRMREGA